MIAERMDELGIALPAVFAPVGNYLGCVLDGEMVYVGGHGPVDGETVIQGKVGTDITLEQARDAARMTGLSIAATPADTPAAPSGWQSCRSTLQLRSS